MLKPSRIFSTGNQDLHRGTWNSMSLVFLLPFVALLGALSCCNKKGVDAKAAGSPVSPELHEKLMRDNPYYRSIVEGPDARTATHQFLERIKAKHTTDQLQEWALSLLSANAGADRPVDIRKSDVPDFIQTLDPPLTPFVTVYPKSHVSIDWGGGWGHWGLFIGPSNFRPSNPTLVTVTWVPGIIAYRTGK